MSESDPSRTYDAKAGRDTPEAQSSTLGGVWGDPRLSASVMSDANEGSRDKRRPWVWALAWGGGVVAVVAVLVLILR